MRGPSLALALALSGCFYSPGSYHFDATPFAGHRVSLPCLDVAVALTEDARATSPVVRYSFGNHCTHTAIVDLAGVRAVGHYLDGSKRELHAYDPRHELRALPLDAWWAASEEIMYVAADPPQPYPVDVCIDVGAVERTAEPASRWMCMAEIDEGAP